ncbi:MAG: co-chaperone DjlA [Xanthomonadales bacterium]|nr:co-chaperone DjlA [Xanthomonadales bacterium]
MTAKSFKIPGHWWGKIIGGVIGLFRGGLTGAVIGALLGHMVDRFLAGIMGVGATQKAFFDALFGSLGHLAKADGRVTETEIRMVESLMQQMRISGEDRQRAIRLFNQGKQPEFDLQATLHPFVQHSMVRQDLRQMFMQIMVEAAFSSGSLTPAERDVLLRVASALRIPEQLFNAMLQARGPAWGAGGGRYEPGAGAGRRPVQPMASLDQDYAQLGLTRKASDAEIKKAYRKLVGQYHPDKLVSRGLPEEMMEMAKTRVRDINTAYDRIKQARGFK